MPPVTHGPAAVTSKFTFEDMMSLRRIGDPAVSPRNNFVAFSAVEVNLDQNARTSHLWIAPLGMAPQGIAPQGTVPQSGGVAYPITSHPAGEDRPRWSPTGDRLLFVSARDGSSQVWVQNFDASTGMLTGDPRRVTAISTGASGALWSPDGRNILFTSEVDPACPDSGCNKQRDEDREKGKVKARLFTRLLFRHWSTYNFGKRTHLFIIPVEGGIARDLTPGDHDAPPFSLGGQDMYAFSPDGQEVAFTSNIAEVEATSTNNDLFVVPVSGGAPKKITSNPGSDSTPAYSPDGRWIAYRAQMEPGYESDRFRLMLFDRKSGKVRNLTENFDRWVGAFTWTPDSKTIYFTAENEGEAPIYKLDIDGGAPVSIEPGENDEISVTPDGRNLVFVRTSVQQPNEVFLRAIESPGSGTAAVAASTGKAAQGSATQLTHLNERVLSRFSLSPLEPFWFEGAGGARVQGFLLKPPGFDPSLKYPVKFLIHGGPEGNWGNAWSFRWNPNLFASDGYVVVMINFHGSTGYGQEFTRSIRADWGGKPYLDLMRGLDHVLREYSFVDGSRVCALGASYGGYMANWILGHTDRFKCIVSHDGAFNLESMYGSTEELWFPEWEFMGTPWTNRAMYRRWSPHQFAAAFKTPTLVIHGQLDYRLDVSEGFQLFTALQRRKIPSKMLYFPDEGHWVLKPQNSRLWYKTVNQWVDSYLKSSPAK
jgi:dipeptidyl aminopeptidase/acylaminoacyl peptidase